MNARANVKNIRIPFNLGLPETMWSYSSHEFYGYWFNQDVGRMYGCLPISIVFVSLVHPLSETSTQDAGCESCSGTPTFQLRPTEMIENNFIIISCIFWKLKSPQRVKKCSASYFWLYIQIASWMSFFNCCQCMKKSFNLLFHVDTLRCFDLCLFCPFHNDGYKNLSEYLFLVGRILRELMALLLFSSDSGSSFRSSSNSFIAKMEYFHFWFFFSTEFMHDFPIEK